MTHFGPGFELAPDQHTSFNFQPVGMILPWFTPPPYVSYPHHSPFPGLFLGFLPLIFMQPKGFETEERVDPIFPQKSQKGGGQISFFFFPPQVNIRIPNLAVASVFSPQVPISPGPPRNPNSNLIRPIRPALEARDGGHPRTAARRALRAGAAAERGAAEAAGHLGGSFFLPLTWPFLSFFWFLSFSCSCVSFSFFLFFFFICPFFFCPFFCFALCVSFFFSPLFFLSFLFLFFGFLSFFISFFLSLFLSFSFLFFSFFIFPFILFPFILFPFFLFSCFVFSLSFFFLFLFFHSFFFDSFCFSFFLYVSPFFVCFCFVLFLVFVSFLLFLSFAFFFCFLVSSFFFCFFPVLWVEDLELQGGC